MAQKSINILKEVCEFCYKYEVKRKEIFYGGENEKSKAVSGNLLAELSKLENNLSPTSYERYLRKIKKLLATKFLEASSLEKSEIEEKIGSFSISKIMQIAPLTVEEAQ